MGPVTCNRPARFTIHAPGVNHNEFLIKCTGPELRTIELPVRRIVDGETVLVDWLPEVLGHYQIQVCYRDLPIYGSPFTVMCFDAAKVKGHGLQSGHVGLLNQFRVDASNAGPGELCIHVYTSDDPAGQGRCSVAHQLRPTGRRGLLHASFTPATCAGHSIAVQYNGQHITGSPFYCIIADGKKVLASGAGLQPVPVNAKTKFHLDAQYAGEADLKIKITDPKGGFLTPILTGEHSTGYDIEYTPLLVGCYRIDMSYANIVVPGSPFSVQAYDSSRIKVLGLDDGILDRPVLFRVEAKGAGTGDLTVSVYAHDTTVRPELKQIGTSELYEAMFVPVETAVHSIEVTLNGQPIPDSPFQIQVFDVSCIQIDSLSSLHLVAVNKSVSINVDTKGLPEDILSAKLIDPSGKTTPVNCSKANGAGGSSRLWCVKFTPTSPGSHCLYVMYAGLPIGGSPYTCEVYDASMVKLVDAGNECLLLQEYTFIVNTCDAGIGDLEVFAITAKGRQVTCQRHRISADRWRYQFTPQHKEHHEITVLFNSQECKNCSKVVHIKDPSVLLKMQEPITKPIRVAGKSTVKVFTSGLSVDIDLLKVTVKAPNRELVPSRIVLQPDKNYTVEYSSKYTGRHMVETLYANQPVMGSPFFVEIYDPNKIRIEGGTTGTVGMPVDFEVISIDAGKAELGVSVTSPSGHSLTYDLQPTPRGDRVRYTPNEQGAHQIFVTYGGLNVPGCPISQEIGIDSSVRTVFGEGAQSGTLNQPTSFFVDTQGRNGDLFIHIQGPTQTMRYTVKQEANGRYCVSYTPTETGQYRIELKFNGHTVNGTPLHPIISERGNVSALGLFDRMVNGKFNLTMNQMNTFEFDTSRSGEGVLRCEVRGPNGSVPVNVQGSAGRYVVSYMPTLEGDYQMSVYWNGQLMPEFPVTGSTQSYLSNGMQSSVQTNTMHQTTNYSNGGAPSYSDKVIMTGMGLNTANAQQMAEFVIDGSQAGQGIPIVKMNGQSDVAVDIVPLTNNRYKCSYTAMEPGFYMLSINWSERQVTGSPFKVNVVASTQPQNVQCRGDALSRAIALKQSEATIDVREAGPGMISAQCMGPTKVALCQIKLVDLGIYKLTMTPQENGRHILQIKYGKEHVPGSPFELKVSRPADASKVRVSGPGVENGILATYRSHFLCEMQGAGTGQLVVRVRGPSGAFNVDIQKGSDRTIMCRYDPTDVGRYRISVLWSDVEVPGSPFTVQIFDTKSQLDASAAKARYKRPPSTGPSVAFGGGGGGGMNRNALAAGVNGITLNEEY